MTTFRTTTELIAFEPELSLAPRDIGTLELVVRRPAVGEREVLEIGRLTFGDGLEGDTWKVRGSKRTSDGASHTDMQLNVMSARLVGFLAVDRDRRALAGDQLYVDLDLSHDNLPVGIRLAIGEAVIEVTEQPHLGCAKFVSRFGEEAMRYVNSAEGRRRRLRGLNARVVVEGEVRPGDKVRKVETPAP